MPVSVDRRLYALAVLLVFPLVSVTLTGCASRPSASLDAARITELTLGHVGVTFDVKVTNPWLVPLPLVSPTGQLSSSRLAPPVHQSSGALPWP